MVVPIRAAVEGRRPSDPKKQSINQSGEIQSV